MAKEARNTQDTAWQHAETREAILAAARSIVARDGEGRLSLDSVAEAAGFAPAAIYAYFPSKPDMLASLFCDDMVAFARGLSDTFPFSDAEPAQAESADVFAFAPHEPAPEAPVEQQQEPAPDSADAATDEAQPSPAEVAECPEPAAEPEYAVAAAPELVEEIAAAESAEPDAPAEPTAEPTAGAAAPSDAGELADMKLAISRLEARKVDAWLERRLRVFEKTLADIATRLDTIETTTTRSSNMVEENVRNFAGRAEALEKRQREAGDGVAEKLEAGERKARGAAAEMRAALNDVYGRLESLEIAKGIAVTPAPALDAQWDAPEPAPPVSEKKTDKPLTAAAETYLSAARRAARTAAELADIERGNTLVASARMSWTRTAFILAGCAALGVVLVVAGVMLRYGGSAHKTVHPAVAARVVHPVAARKVAAAVKLAAAPAKPAAAMAKPAHTDMAVYRLTALASTGNPDAELLLGLRAMDGDGVAQDDAKAARLFQQSADQGNAIAQYWLGTLYQRGRGVTQDAAAAWRLYQAAARKGNVKAMYNLADADARGNGVKPNADQAVHWFWVAAMQGYVDAQYNLAVLYERGQGVPQSLVNAYKWYAIAAAAGDKDSRASIEALKTQLKPGDLAAGERAAAAYKPGPVNAAANTMPAPAALASE
ncbi:MAG: TetR family transcriptional regulator [Rhizomicrobium sp.]